MNENDWKNMRSELFDEWIDGLNNLDSNDREVYFNLLKAKFCMHCGSDDTGCQCWNDE